MMRSAACTKILIVSFAVWFVFLFFVARHLSSLRFTNGGTTTENEFDVVNSKLETAIHKLKVLQQHNDDLKLLISEISNPNNLKDDKAIDKLLNRAENLAEDVSRKMESSVPIPDGGPEAQYELMRKQINDDAREFWFYISAQTAKLREKAKKNSPEIADQLSEFLNVATQHKLSLFKDLYQLGEVDGYASWREAEAHSLAKELERRLKHLQNPKDCSTAKKIVCNLNKGCGFGCQIHHAAYCLIVAYATKRTLILTSKGWRYHKNGWEDIFLPVSDTCLSPAGSSRVGWPGKPEAQVIALPIIDTLTPKPDYLPPAIPSDLAPRLTRLHKMPIVWWIGQMLRYLMRPQPSTTDFLNYSKKRLKFQKPIVGVHIRRTDKIGTEAAFHPIEEYMKKVSDWYDQQENNNVEIKSRRIFLATDDPKVIAEAREKYPDYEVLGDPEIAKTAAMSTRYSDNSLYGILLDVYLLSLSDHLVCTFSSQVCRAAYELMQTYVPDATSHFTSLDDSYYYGGQNGHPAVAVIDHQAETALELDLKVGDQIAIAGNHWDGYSKGRNLRTNQIGLFPSFKVQNRVKVADFPSYAEVPNTK
ncbi:UNVERIFIED_CONTAM: hypothetical protein PYX00_009258 [Menopon gallinae]|uniref:Alpha-(1,6)-fucosyltransferase n=1 Tax=Menopon gallinae TaxID=328185 RepID=A0AAW2HB91_9NEOP